jgi:choline-sulfatase
VPCLISYPGHIQPGTRVDGLMEATDLVPTLLDYAGVVREPSLQGRTMRSLLAGDTSAARDSIYAEYRDPGRNNWTTVRTEDWLYASNASVCEVLFDLQEDPHQLNNIAKDPACAAALSDMRALALERSVEARPPTRYDARY